MISGSGGGIISGGGIYSQTNTTITSNNSYALEIAISSFSPQLVVLKNGTYIFTVKGTFTTNIACLFLVNDT